MKEIDYRKLEINPSALIGDKWMLISAGKEGDYGTMTASWGHLGAIWGHGTGKSTSVIYIRPQRNTKKYVDKEEYYSLCFFEEKYRKDLAYLGSHSFAKEDKVAATSLTPNFSLEAPYFEEASLILICRKLYKGELKEENFIDKEVMEDNYPRRDFHSVYIGEIVKAYSK